MYEITKKRTNHNITTRNTYFMGDQHLSFTRLYITHKQT